MGGREGGGGEKRDEKDGDGEQVRGGERGRIRYKHRRINSQRKERGERERGSVATVML